MTLFNNFLNDNNKHISSIAKELDELAQARKEKKLTNDQYDELVGDITDLDKIKKSVANAEEQRMIIVAVQKMVKLANAVKMVI